MLNEVKQGRILVVEDDPMVLELITTRLSLAGFHAFYARVGRLVRKPAARPRLVGAPSDARPPIVI